MPISPKSFSDLRRGSVPKIGTVKRENNKLRNCNRWRALAKMVVSEQGLCADPFGVHEARGEKVLTEEVHHIVPLELDESLAYTRSNLIGLCRSCHRRADVMAGSELKRQVVLCTDANDKIRGGGGK